MGELTSFALISGVCGDDGEEGELDTTKHQFAYSNTSLCWDRPDFTLMTILFILLFMC